MRPAGAGRRIERWRLARGGAPMGDGANGIGARPPLTPDQLRRRCDPATLTGAAGAVCATAGGLVGQERAARALALGLAMSVPGFNVYAAGPAGTGKMAALRTALP